MTHTDEETMLMQTQRRRPLHIQVTKLASAQYDGPTDTAMHSATQHIPSLAGHHAMRDHVFDWHRLLCWNRKGSPREQPLRCRLLRKTEAERSTLQGELLGITAVASGWLL